MNKETKKFRQEFTEVKRKILVRDNWRCQVPQKLMRKLGILAHYGTLTVDHIRKRSLGGNNNATNLITLCIGCHTFFEIQNNYWKENQLYKILKNK